MPLDCLHILIIGPLIKYSVDGIEVPFSWIVDKSFYKVIIEQSIDA